jgi:hypothetical protein
MAQTTAERQNAFRARRAIMDGTSEVRGVFLPPVLHAALKAAAKKMLAAYLKRKEPREGA